ncbi:hypothetical protein M441DRAFT_58180 [Trichoderma asperellum CBS 433.97]|uniref:Uncharacterized protein n=1 Tax=Trichoderma asperellum (strain ATCC 204424 / CBS 433.97 / NBRC 101777) TaxID=1042311 RepID=A0A2T3Z7C4_TRIA4|nr:hypothetical protein M441DRAFT_58180 [Trichoderma asperellum CBS 433.97]PTB40696.1 hypothetical protein M441DRAFT_58180 [Trichoderma asperellum CBS 433.97]
MPACLSSLFSSLPLLFSHSRGPNRGGYIGCMTDGRKAASDPLYHHLLQTGLVKERQLLVINKPLSLSVFFLFPSFHLWLFLSFPPL